MWSVLTRRFSWLDVSHPVARREMGRNRQELPKFIRKLTDPWTMLGYAAMLHAVFFAISLLSYNQINRAFPNLTLPFLTPFGTPVAAALLHSVLYWVMLIGVVNFTSSFVASDVETGMWPLLRTTPYTSGEILAVKMLVVGRVWARVLRTLFLTRLVALLVIPITAMSLRASENFIPLSLSAIGGAIFVLQPFVDAFLVASISALAALLIRGLMWARVGAYAGIALVYGVLSGAGGLWLIFQSPMGALAGLLVPLNIWAPLVAAITQPASAAELTGRIVMLILVYAALPLAAGFVAFTVAARVSRAQQ
jgi:hypothetical protein